MCTTHAHTHRHVHTHTRARAHARTRAHTHTHAQVLDANKLAEGNEFFKLGSVEHSPDHKIIAYTTDVKGSEYYDLRFRDAEVFFNSFDCHFFKKKIDFFKNKNIK